jgi:hypothetical protein
MKPNRFGAFADEEVVAAEVKEVKVAAQKAAEPKKKVVVKVAKAPINDAEGEEFEKVADRTQTQRGAPRGGRGDRGGERRVGRGGDRGRGDRPRGEPRAEGEVVDGERRGGDRRGRGDGERRGRGDGERRGRGDGERRGRGDGERRGRGDRPRTAMPITTGEDGEIIVVEGEELPQRAERRGGRGPRFEGKPREDGHPMDRQDGTGRGRRVRKDGGDRKWTKPEGEVAGVAGEETKEGEQKPVRERKPREEQPKPEPIVEEEIGFTLNDYMAAKQAKTQGLYKVHEVRQHEKLDAKNIVGVNKDHSEMATTKLIKQVDTMATRSGQNAELFGFQAERDDDVEISSTSRGRGGRGRGGDRPVRQDRPQTQRGGRKGGKLIVDDNDFPAL